jgi:hypothetical protein
MISILIASGWVQREHERYSNIFFIDLDNVNFLLQVYYYHKI